MKRVVAIARKTLRMILEASRDMYPREFGAVLRADQGTIDELISFPGSIGGHRLDAVSHPLDAEGLEDLFPTPRTHRLARLWIREEPPDLLREVPRVHRIREESIPPVLDDLPHTGDVRDDHRFPGRHRFERD